MNITFVLGSLSVSGGNRTVLDLALAMSSKANVRILVIDGSKGKGRWFDKIGELDVFRQDKNTQPRQSDVYVATSFTTWDYVSEIDSEGKKFGYVQGQEPEFVLHPGTKSYIKSCFDKGRGIRPIACSGWLTEWLAADYGYEDVPVIGHGLDRESFYPDPWFPSTGVVRGLIVGQYGADGNVLKDKEYNAFKAIHGLDIEIFHVTTGKSLFSEQVYAHWVSPRTKWLRRIYSSCDFAIVASVREGEPVLDKELMACGVPISRAISKGHGDHELKDGYNCVLADYEDLDGLVDNVERLSVDLGLRKRLRDGGLESAGKFPHWEDIADRWLEVVG